MKRREREKRFSPTLKKAANAFCVCYEFGDTTKCVLVILCVEFVSMLEHLESICQHFFSSSKLTAIDCIYSFSIFNANKESIIINAGINHGVTNKGRTELDGATTWDHISIQFPCVVSL